MTQVYRAIPTRYKDILFRSKLEADWAITLDAFGVRWEYEPEGRYWGGVYYAPDFWFPEVQQWFEVKGWPQPEDHQKWRSLAANWSPKGSPSRADRISKTIGRDLLCEVSQGEVVWLPKIVIGYPEGDLATLPHADELLPQTFLVAGYGFVCCLHGPEIVLAAEINKACGAVYAVNQVSPFPCHEAPCASMWGIPVA